MSADEQGLVFESFLKKRKDKMKLKWVTYWFRLQNTTLFFYTKKHGSASHLRGHYYIYTVQSVREVKSDNKQFVFEITMKNGKKKVLAAETEELRAAWTGLLWKAMQLPGPGHPDSACVWHDVADLKERAGPRHHSSSESDSGASGGRPGSFSSFTDPRGLAQPPTGPPLDAGRAWSIQRTSPAVEENYQQGEREATSSVLGYSKAQHQSIAAQEEEEEEGLYDVPTSNREARGESAQGSRAIITESIYDVPKSLLRKASESRLEVLSGVETLTLLDDIKLSLGSDHVSWINSSSTS